MNPDLIQRTKAYLEAFNRASAERDAEVNEYGFEKDEERWLHVMALMPPVRELVGAIVQGAEEIDRLTAERDALVADLAAAAGELMVPIPEPGTTASRMMLANVLMRRERDGALAELEEARLTLAAERGRAEGAPSEGWTCERIHRGRPTWLRRAIVQGYDGTFYVEYAPIGYDGWFWCFQSADVQTAFQPADTARAAMRAADASK